MMTESDFETFNSAAKEPETESFLSYFGYQREVDAQGYARTKKIAIFLPKYKLDYRGKTIYLTEKLNTDDVVAYVEKDGKLIPRAFRRSNSGGNRHAYQWFDGGGTRISKGEFVPNISYEKGTVVDRVFNNILDTLPGKDMWVQGMWRVMYDVYGKNIPDNNFARGGELYNQLPKAAQEYYDETQVFDDLLKENNVNTTWHRAFKNWLNTDQIEWYYDSLSLEKVVDFTSSRIINRYSSTHKSLGAVDNQVMTAKIKSSNPDFDGREIQITIATAENDGLSRVENIVFADDSGTSFFTQKNPITAWLLTSKPIDYASQVPDFLLQSPKAVRYWKYVDLRPFMQQNPLIKERKKLQS